MVNILTYEDLAFTTEATTSRLYSFLNINIDGGVEIWLKLVKEEISFQERGVPGTYNTVRSDSAKTAQRWRNKLPFSVVQSIQDTSICKNELQLLHYTIFISLPEQTDAKIPIIREFRNKLFI